MKKSIMLLLLAAPLIFAASVEIGTSVFSSTKPFCGDWTETLRYQVVVEASEFSEAMIINSIEYFLAPGAAHNDVQFDEFTVYMGYCATDELSANYNSNYINGWKYKVFESTTSITFYDTDPTIYFDTPFFYQPSQGNLVFEIIWPNGKGEFWVYNDIQDKTTLVHGAFDLETGDQYMERPHLLIHGELALEQTTFAGIKASFR